MGNKEGSIIFSMDLRNPFLSQERELSLSNTTLKTEIIGYLPTGEKILLEFIGTNKAIGASALVTDIINVLETQDEKDDFFKGNYVLLEIPLGSSEIGFLNLKPVFEGHVSQGFKLTFEYVGPRAGEERLRDEYHEDMHMEVHKQSNESFEDYGHFFSWAEKKTPNYYMKALIRTPEEKLESPTLKKLKLMLNEDKNV